MKSIDDLKAILEPSNKIICYMCHLSSDCGECCKKCVERCNSDQVCMIGHPEQYDRWQTWQYIINNPEIEIWKP